ncbi:MAG: hypothetical protein V1495_11005 [Pseudomonadota bacterium]
MGQNKTLVYLLIGLAASCAGKRGEPARRTEPAVEVLRDGLSPAAGLAIDAPGTYLVARPVEGGSWMLASVHGGKLEDLSPASSSPTAIAYDARHGRLFWAEKDLLKIAKVGGFLGLVKSKKSDTPPIEIPISGAGEITSIDYSILNARAYFCSPSAKQIWSLDPKKKTVEVILGAEALEKTGLGEPRYLRASSDGRRLYLVATQAGNTEGGSAIAIVNLKSRQTELLKAFPGTDLTGIEPYRSHLMTADRATGRVFAVTVKGGEVAIPAVPADWKGPVTAFSMDLGAATFLLPVEAGSSAKLVRFGVAVKE